MHRNGAYSISYMQLNLCDMNLQFMKERALCIMHMYASFHNADNNFSL